MSPDRERRGAPAKSSLARPGPVVSSLSDRRAASGGGIIVRHHPIRAREKRRGRMERRLVRKKNCAGQFPSPPGRDTLNEPQTVVAHQHKLVQTVVKTAVETANVAAWRPTRRALPTGLL